ncbi:UDP-N-acetylglucosamine 4,6-dehydratase family protein, partial [Xanthovirga aplysinae]|uniref:UDP-N-acetylglucosamine 4,6-dehydratase family protein n=1 Tax=Xanthovirga aplysinae TaxID=2529853 RepID=UPI0012BCC971
LVTGAAGSIGKEICRQLFHYSPKELIFLDQAESPLYELEFELNQNPSPKDIKIHYLIGDITNQNRMKEIFEAFQPELVFHAAAYKHVPTMENNPSEAVAVNVMGTKNLADLSVKFGVEKFVMVSTDKAVNPTNVMGATKRVAEIYTQSLDGVKNNNTRFVTTRFGNVLCSNGSVIPLFGKQLKAGGPLTVTDPEITRYFMTIPEACQLVLEAGAMGEGGEVFILDMGESVKIIDIAKKMIKLFDLQVGKDIDIKITGLRPGEKLHEELMTKKENTLSTHHPKIMKVRVRAYDLEPIQEVFQDLEYLLENRMAVDLVRKLKQIVPEYKSKNSVFEKLDVD